MDDIEAIKRLKATYFRSLDSKDWAAFEQVFTEDATLRFDAAVGLNGADPQTSPLFTSRPVIARVIRSAIGTCPTVHHGHMPEIDILSPTEARGVWAMEDIIDYPDRTLKGYGHYHETYRLEGGRWQISSMRLTRLRLSTSGPSVFAGYGQPLLSEVTTAS